MTKFRYPGGATNENVPAVVPDPVTLSQSNGVRPLVLSSDLSSVMYPRPLTASPLPLVLPGPEARHYAVMLVVSVNSRSEVAAVPGQLMGPAKTGAAMPARDRKRAIPSKVFMLFSVEHYASSGAMLHASQESG